MCLRTALLPLLLAGPQVAALRAQQTLAAEALGALDGAEEFAGGGRAGASGPASAEELERQRYEEGIVTEYTYNLTHFHGCPRMVDRVSVMKPLIIPELKIAFCYIAKAACSEFKDLFNLMNNISSAHIGFGRDYFLSSPQRLMYDQKSITRENGWKFAVFTRDPALRYLSAFGSTCMSVSPRGQYEHPTECCGPLISDNTISASRMVQLFQDRLLRDLKNGTALGDDDHWSSQVNVFEQCGWEHFNPNAVDFHGDISYGDVNAQVMEMLSLNGPIDDRAKSLVDRFFPPHKIAGHKSPIRNIPPDMFYNNLTTLKALMQVYKEDYDIIPRVGRGFTEAQLLKTPEQRRTEWVEMVREAEADRRPLVEIAERARLERKQKAAEWATFTDVQARIWKHAMDVFSNDGEYKGRNLSKVSDETKAREIKRDEEELAKLKR